MGCGSSHTARGDIAVLTLTDINTAWQAVSEGVSSGSTSNLRNNLIVKRSGWKTIRIFVSSTFKDFHQEREGVPKDADTEETLRTCLGEIDRCYQDNVMPFFVNMTSERIGWVPIGCEVPRAVRDEYKWIDGLSVTEMEILHGAYRSDNPNALFMLRDPGFLDQVPPDQRQVFVDSNPIAPYKLQILKKMIHDRFPKQRVVYYRVAYQGYNEQTRMPLLKGLSQDFAPAVFRFFKQRIEKQYPLDQCENRDVYEVEKEKHESFMKSRSTNLLGRDEIVGKMQQYITSSSGELPMLIVGGPGSGKSSIMARVADTAVSLAVQGKIKNSGGLGWHVFYHFVGAVPGSTDLEVLIKRLLKEIGTHDENDMPSDLDTLVQTCCGVLANPNTRPLIMIIDALNQLDDQDQSSQVVNWIPRKLAPKVRVVMSMIDDTPQHKALMSRTPRPNCLEVMPLTLQARQMIVETLLGKYNKRLDEEQMKVLLSKQASENPLWLSIACEELRVFGLFRKLLEKVNSFADGLLELEMQVLDRFEKEGGGALLVATLCLLEVSNTGLLEVELLTMLAWAEKLGEPFTPPDSIKREAVLGTTKAPDSNIRLAPFRWAAVYRTLKPFLRPFGDSGEGRLDFYHRSLSKAVRRKYFFAGNPSKEKRSADVYLWWHSKLARYFEHCPNLDRQLEEYPQHLIKIEDKGRLQKFLCRWDVFDRLFDEEYSLRLVKYWRAAGGYDVMEQKYDVALQEFLERSDVKMSEKVRRLEMVSRVLAQNGRLDKAKQHAKAALSRQLELDSSSIGDSLTTAALYHLQAYIGDEQMKNLQYMTRKELPEMVEVLQHFKEAIKLFEENIGKEGLRGDVKTRTKFGKILNRTAFFYAGIHLRGGYGTEYSKTSTYEQAHYYIDRAIEVFRQLKNDILTADAMTTKGVCYGNPCPEQIDVYTKAYDGLLAAAGPLHPLMDRLLLNTGIYYEEVNNARRAYEYFRRWHQLCVDLFGYDHYRTWRSIDTLNEPTYARIARSQGDPIPQMPDGAVVQR